MRTAAKPPAFLYRPGDGIRYVWDGGPWITAVTDDRGHLLAHIAAPETRSAEAMMVQVDRHRTP